MWQRSRTNKDNVGASNEFFRHDRTALASFDVIHVLYESPLRHGPNVSTRSRRYGPRDPHAPNNGDPAHPTTAHHRFVHLSSLSNDPQQSPAPLRFVGGLPTDLQWTARGHNTAKSRANSRPQRKYPREGLFCGCLSIIMRLCAPNSTRPRVRRPRGPRAVQGHHSTPRNSSERRRNHEIRETAVAGQTDRHTDRQTDRHGT